MSGSRRRPFHRREMVRCRKGGDGIGAHISEALILAGGGGSIDAALRPAGAFGAYTRAHTE